MDILTSSPLPSPLARESPLHGSGIQLKLLDQLPSATTQANTTHPVSFTVTQSAPDGKITLQAADGKTFTAQAQPAPQVGSKVVLPPGTLAQTSSSAPSPAGNTPSLPTSLPLLAARLLPPADTKIIQTSTTTPLNLTNLQLTANQSNNIEITSKIPSFPSLPSPPALQQLTSNALSVPQSLLTFANMQTVIPEGPLNLSLPQNMSASTTPQGPATLTLQTPTTATLAVPGQPRAVAVTLPFPSQLPTRTPLPVALATNPENPHQPMVFLTQPVALPAGNNTTATSAPTQPFTPPSLSSLKVLLSPGNTTPPPVGTPVTARVTGPAASQPQADGPPASQPILLAGGQRAVLQSPQAFPVESMLVVEFPTLTANAQVLRAQPAGPQGQHPQPQTASATLHSVAANTPAIPAGTILQGTLSGQTETGRPLVTISQPQTFAGQTLTLAQAPQQALPLGAQLVVRTQPNGMAQVLEVALPDTAARTQTLTHFAVEWPALTQALTRLQNQAPALAAQATAQLPQVAALLPGLVAFTEALRKNRAEDVLGEDTLRLLKATGLDLSSDIRQLAQLQQHQPDTSWRATLFPYIETPGTPPRQGGFFWRREKKDDPRGPTSTRFVIELSMSQMGPLQLDGLLSYPEIWLKLRRQTPLEPDFITQLQNITSQTLEQFGLTGGIAVEVTKTFPVDPMAEILASSSAALPTSA